MWWRTSPADVGRVEDRLSTLYISHAHVDRDGNGLVVSQQTGAVHLPVAMTAAALLGPGVTITHAAVVLCGDSGTSLGWVGEQGVRMYAHGLSTTRSARLLLRQAWLVSSAPRRLSVARRMYALRFPGEDVARLSMQQLRGREGARVRAAYRAESQRTGVPWHGRQYLPGHAMEAGDTVNRLLSAANSSLYGAVHAAAVSLGCSPGLGFIHTGHALAFVHDIADLYKAEITIPTAFDTAAAGKTTEAAARHAVRDRIRGGRLLERIVRDVYDLLDQPTQPVLPEPEPEPEPDDGPLLWDDNASTGSPTAIAGGINYDLDPSTY